MSALTAGFSFPFMWWALAASLVLAGIHAYLGFHVVQRGVIFVDLALAQMAAIGVALTLLLKLDDQPILAFMLPATATLLGAVIFAWLRQLERRVPLEAFIGITFAVAQATVILILEKTAAGTEHLKDTMIGSLYTVSPAVVLETAALYAVIGMLHYLFRRPLFFISENPAAARAAGVKIFLWDVFFYGSFGLVVTSSVRIAGVLLVFGFLVIPAVAGAVLAQTAGKKLTAGWVFGFIGSLVGLAVAFAADLPASPTILITMACLLIVVGGWSSLSGRRRVSI